MMQSRYKPRNPSDNGTGGMPKYEYPAHIYATQQQQTDRKAASPGQDSSSSEDEEAEFFSNAEILQSRAHDIGIANSHVIRTDVGQLSAGRAYIEGGRQYQQRNDNYSDLIDELLFEEQPEPTEALLEQKIQIESELRLVEDAFFKGKPDDKTIPVYADYVYSGSDDDLSSASPMKAIGVPVEIPSIEAVCEKVEVLYGKSLDQEHTVYTKNPKKQKKKRKPRVVLIDDEPIKQIEIIRSQPEEKIRPEKFTNKPQLPQYQPKTTLSQMPVATQPAITNIQPSAAQNNANGNSASKNSKAKRKAQERQQTQSVDGKIGTNNSLASQGKKAAPQSVLGNNNKPGTRDNSVAAIDSTSTQRLSGQRAKNQTSMSLLSNKSSPFKAPTTNTGSKTTMDTASQKTEGSAKNQGQTFASQKSPVSASQDKQAQSKRGRNSASNSQLRTPLTAKGQTAAIPSGSKNNAQAPVFKFKKEAGDEAGSNIWARLEPTNNNPQKKIEASGETQQAAAAAPEETKVNEPQTSKQKKRKNKKKNKSQAAAQKSAEEQGFGGMPIGQMPSGQDMFDGDILQQVSSELMMNLGQQAQNFEGDRSLLAEQLVQMLKKSLETQLGFPQPDRFDSYQRDIVQNRPEQPRAEVEAANIAEQTQAAAAISQAAPTEEDEKFHEMVSVQIKQTVRTFEWKLDSVRKERESVIDIIEHFVKEVFEPKRGERQHGPTVPIGVKQYGSQASFLAVDSSDVDLAVTGLKLGGEIDTQIREMRKLYLHLEDRKAEGFIKRCEIIESASVPLIKLQVNLQVVQEINRNKSILQAQKEGYHGFKPEPLIQIDESMVILHIDITFDDYNTSVLNQRNTAIYQQTAEPFTLQNLQSHGFMPPQQQQQLMHQTSADTYFYLRDNPQCSSANQKFAQRPNYPYMQPGLQSPFMNPNMNNMAMTSNQLAAQSCSLAISSVHKIKELQKEYKDLRNIVLIIKKLLAKHDLHKPYSGGLNSYSIVLMTSTFLEKFGINHVSALSQNLTEFLKFFGNYFDPATHGLDGTRFFQLSAEQREKNELIYIRDFQNSANNTSRSAFRIYEIRKVFSNAYKTIMENQSKFKAEDDPSIRMKINVISSFVN